MEPAQQDAGVQRSPFAAAQDPSRTASVPLLAPAPAPAPALKEEADAHSPRDDENRDPNRASQRSPSRNPMGGAGALGARSGLLPQAGGGVPNGGIGPLQVCRFITFAAYFLVCGNP